MSNLIHEYGTAQFTIDATEKLTVFSRDHVRIYQKGSAWYLLAEVLPNSTYISSAFSTKAEIRVEASGNTAFYQKGLAPVITERIGLRSQVAPGVLNATGALTAAMMVSGIVTSTTATVAGTVPTGTVMDNSLEISIGESFDWSVIKTGANAFTVTAATGHTLVGLAVVATATAGMFRTRKTAANTFVTYRIG